MTVSEQTSADPAQANYAQLVAEVLRLKQQICDAIGMETGMETGMEADIDPAPALDTLCQRFALSPFERQLLLCCVGMELDPQFAVVYAHVDPNRPYPTPGFALRVFAGYWSALAPQAPLRYWHLLDLEPMDASFIHQPLKITEWGLFYLTGRPSLEQRLLPCLKPLTPTEPVLASQQALAQTLVENGHRFGQTDPSPVQQLLAQDPHDACQVAALAAWQRGMSLYALDCYTLPGKAEELDLYRRLLSREIGLRPIILLIQGERLIDSQESSGDRHALSAMLDELLTQQSDQCLLYATQTLDPLTVPLHAMTLKHPDQAEQVILWQHALGSAARDIEPALQQLTQQFALSGQQIQAVASTLGGPGEPPASDTPQALTTRLWRHARQQSQRNVHQLAQVLAPGELVWDDLVLPPQEQQILRDMIDQIAQRQRVYQQWGFAKQQTGLGISALFAGASGTGKTLAARLIASQLQLDIYHIDLSGVADKYIGETEKNLERIFRAAENSGAILLFDEADALFGKRSKVQDSRDRYANMGISYLLQRMETYTGLSILTTNLKSALDDAFLRRLRFILQFPYPSAAQRQRIWQRMFPSTAPTRDIRYEKLARLSLAGGAIRNIALQAAFSAAAAGQDITMTHLLQACRQEYLKAEKTLTEGLVADWVG
ncbi:MAG: ATP-binding protein [Pseudomonadales bacterium]